MKPMPLALLISSHVAASMVGGDANQCVLNAAGIETMLVPTVLYGRHPGRGAPGGGIVAPEMVLSMLDGIADEGRLDITDLVLTGYFGDAAQVFAAAGAIDAVRAGRRADRKTPLIIIDPIMGDAPEGLYVAPQIATAIRDQLVPRADLVTPNAFELGHLTGRTLTDLASMVRAAQSLGRPALVSSLPRQGRIGVMYVSEGENWIVTHDRCPTAPKGTGDALTASFAAALLAGADPKAALESSVAAVVSLVIRANEGGHTELSLVAAAAMPHDPIIRLSAEPL
jgi:pyridoxine kinase